MTPVNDGRDLTNDEIQALIWQIEKSEKERPFAGQMYVGREELKRLLREIWRRRRSNAASGEI